MHYLTSARLRTAILAFAVLTTALTIAPGNAAHAEGETHAYSGADLSLLIKNALPGSTIVVHEGSYPRIGFTGVHKSELVQVVAAPGEAQPVIAGAGVSKATNLAFRNLRFSAEVSFAFTTNLEITGSHTKNIRVRDDSHHVLLENNRVEGGAEGIWIRTTGIPLWPAVTDVVVRNNEVFGQTQDNIQIGLANDVVIENNILRDAVHSINHNDGLQIMAGERIAIRNNRFTNHDQAILLKAETTVFGAGAVVKDVLVEGNLIHKERGAGIIASRSTNVTVVNNTSYDNKYADLHIDGDNTGLRVSNNVFKSIYVLKGKARPEYEYANCALWGGKGDLLVLKDPLFIDRIDYRLSEASPCLGRGY